MSGQQSSCFGSINSLFGICDGPELTDRVASYLRRLYPNKPADHVAHDLKMPVATVAKWFSRQNTPSGPAMVRLIGVYGPELLQAVMKDPPDWLDEAARDRERAQLKAQQAQLARRLEELT